MTAIFGKTKSILAAEARLVQTRLLTCVHKETIKQTGNYIFLFLFVIENNFKKRMKCCVAVGISPQNSRAAARLALGSPTPPDVG